ncbi:DegT/DnrJ/EryC1/StrS family aminotransferase [Amycolatopsis acidiphila]|uniref:DegT/DnrJ/EryC1/StrS aminotransferase n=1 Tax=Amycolatopsis acidiphila TaxID=715473 RepID=A0A558AN08_9PSEU|nr:DegT/DnrJ/EryC1/StrS family aminotransferase [Amycolatopsis acidiphila]TVT25656.1 DegT/DnrJ/EryC1/StrS aminotransferase [Amycolatopsis acidiphila]UIJ60414.1 DegT/DnrJ/EryC1/StrS family aminotransferase [Amycolatopsis acidiphila]GHG90317.1 aminotransferase DegT [Amycolatopsis acidiphila]
MTLRREIPLAEPSLAGNEERYVLECLSSGYISSAGPLVRRFEQEFAEAVGASHAVACVNGTAALHVALRLAGAGPERVVAVSTFSFIASANAAHYTGANLWLIDSETTTWNMNTQMLRDEVILRAKLGKKIPDVVEVVHILGHPAEMEPLLELRDKFGIAIVEDAAEALGASWRTGAPSGHQVGTVGDFGCFSFNGNKIITSGGGGMIVTNDRQSADSAKHLTTQAKRATGEYIHDAVGYNYRLTNLAAAVGLAQLEQLPRHLQSKRTQAGRYNELLKDIDLERPPAARWARPSFWLYSVLTRKVKDVSRLTHSMRLAGVEARRLWPPIHTQFPYRSCEKLGGEVAERIYRRGLSLPSSVGLHVDDQTAVAVALRTAISEQREALPTNG